MLEVLEFIFRDFWTWLGTLLLVAAIPMPFRVVIHKNKNEESQNK